MSKIDEVRAAMVQAMKAKDKPRKDALSMLLSALKAKFIDKRADLTEEEENTIILKEIKQAQETLSTAPESKAELIEECKLRIAVYSEFAPKQMSEEEIKEAVNSVIAELGLENPTAKDKGIIMRSLMPKTKGKADGGLVNKIVGEILG
ncbi:MAG: GatB/YqeY domain-containing protein [Ruminococcus sp.]|nr:GatB/YqeY domain-containing protein [Ruminococcus sp.]